MTDRKLTPRAPGKTVRRAALLSGDAALGLFGGTLAAASATFGIAMTLHGPVVDLGKSGNFTVFAQFAPRPRVTEAKVPDPNSRPDEFDTTATASIPGRPLAGGAASAVRLQWAGAESATILVNGRSSVVRVGDEIPGVGKVLAIEPGERPMLRTSGGVIGLAQGLGTGLDAETVKAKP